MDALDLRARFPHVDGWVRGESQPTFKQVESFAKATHTPIGFLFLAEPPVEPIPIPDFRKGFCGRTGRAGLSASTRLGASSWSVGRKRTWSSG
jgi:hypothetical protein